MTEQKTYEETPAWQSPLAITVDELLGRSDAIADAIPLEVTSEVTPEAEPVEGNLSQIIETATPAVTKKFKGREAYMSHNGVMMERDVYYVIPTAVVDHPYPEEHSLGLTYDNNKPKGRLFSGPNRHARRAAEKQKSKKNKS